MKRVSGDSSAWRRLEILVTGGAGYIGSHVCKKHARGHLPVTCDYGIRETIPVAENHPHSKLLVERMLADAG